MPDRIPVGHPHPTIRTDLRGGRVEKYHVARGDGAGLLSSANYTQPRSNRARLLATAAIWA
jgi:hypothetical protein